MVFGYIATSMLLYIFFHYKLLKILDVCILFCMRHVHTPKGVAGAATAFVAPRAVIAVPRARTVWDIPGPAVLPLLGTKWIFLWKYSMTQMHKVYAGDHN